MEKRSTMICDRCQVRMRMMNADFDYLGFNFRAEVLRCPECGQVYLDEELVYGRIAEVEFELEDK